METRLMTSEQMGKVKDLWSYCFEKSDDPFFQWYFDNYCRPEYVLGGFVEQDFAGMIHLNPYQVCLQGQKLDTAYFVGVATAPEHRRKGVMKAMLAEAFAIQRGRGQCVALLMPVMAGIYLPYGFAYCYSKLKYQMPLQELGRVLPKVKGYDITFASEKNVDKISELYHEFTKDKNGFLLRGQKEWGYILGELLHSQREGYAVLLKNQTGCCGYMLYFIKDGVFRIVELVAANAEAKAVLLEYAAQHFSQCSELFWLAPADDLTYLQFQLNSYYPNLQPFMMGRVIDPCRAIADCKLSVPEDSFLDIGMPIELTDSVLAQNNTVFTLRQEDGLVHLRKEQAVQDMTAQVQMDIGTFAQLCFGAFSAEALYRAGAIKARAKKDVQLLAQIFKQKNNYINEYF